jgi:hypothetical protein
MADICVVTTVATTLMACIGQPVCAPDPAVDMLMVCRTGPPVTPCNYTIETLSCRRDDGTTYTRTVKR